MENKTADIMQKEFYLVYTNLKGFKMKLYLNFSSLFRLWTILCRQSSASDKRVGVGVGGFCEDDLLIYLET